MTFDEIPAGGVGGVFAIGGGEEGAGVDDEHASVSPEALSEHFLGLCSGASGGGLSHRYELQAALGKPPRGVVGEAGGEDLGRHLVDVLAATLGLGGEAPGDVVGEIHGHGHASRVGRSDREL
jgi:hypothetical protein